MKLADLQLAVRPRRPMEAMDLGIRLTQCEARPLWRLWFAVTLPVLLLTLGLTLLQPDRPCYLLLWWLKPLYDLALLELLSRMVFGERPALRDSLRRLAGSTRHGLVGLLTWRRLSMSRAYLLPVWLLERLPAAERRARIALLRNRYGGRARWLHTVMAHFELLLALAALSLLFWFTPESHDDSLWTLLSAGSDDARAASLFLLAYYAAMSVVEPFYVAAGFTLYLNRRTELEAWDLELAFRHLRDRLDRHRRAA